MPNCLLVNVPKRAFCPRLFSLGCASAYNIFAKYCQQQNTQHKIAKLLRKRGNRMQKYFAKKNIFLCGKM
jgi:hypothetical protein